MKRHLFFSFLLFFFLIYSNAQNYEDIVGRTYNERHLDLLQYIYNNTNINEDSIAFFSEVDKIHRVAELHSDKELLLETEFMFFNFLSSRNYPLYKDGMKKFIDKVDKAKIQNLQVRTRQALGLHYFYEDNNYAQAISYMSESYTFLRRIPSEELPDKQELIYNIAFVYYNLGYYNTALDYLTIADSLNNEYYKTLLLNIKNIKGLIYQEKGNKSKAILNFLELYNTSLDQNNDIWIRISQNNLAELYFNDKMYDEAIDILLDKHKIINQDIIQPKIELDRNCIYANIYINTGQVQKALEKINNIEKIIADNKEEVLINEKILSLLAYSKGKEGFFDEAYSMMNKALMIKSITDKKKIQELIKQSDNKEHIDAVFKRKTDLENQKKVNQIIIVSASLIIILLLIITFVVIQRQKSLHRQKQMESELTRKKISAELDDAKIQLETITTSLLSKNKELDVYRQELATIQVNDTTDQNLIIRAQHLNNLLTQPILTDEKWVDFKKAFESVHLNYIDNLSIKMPGLTQAELRYIVLRKLKLSNKEIASILGIFPDTIRTYRYRIRKKFNFSDDSELEKIILGY